MTYSVRRPLQSQRGNMVAILTALTGAMMILFSGVTGLMENLSNLNLQTSSEYAQRAGIYSMLAYTRGGIKSRWCFGSSWDFESPTVCNLAHPRSVERLLMTDAQVAFVRVLKEQNPSMPFAEPVILRRIEQRVDRSAINSTHPLYDVVNSADFDFLGAINFKIERLQDASLPVAGSEIHLRVEVELFPRSGARLPGSVQTLKAVNTLTVFPREVGNFALLVGGDLMVDGRSGQRAGDISLPINAPAGSPGIIFDSPVFVNHNIHIPPSTAAPASNVTFAETVFMGRGILKQNGEPARAAARSSLGANLYKNMPGLGGFQRGIKIDDFDDRGLDVITGRNQGTNPDNNLFQACIDRTQVKFNLETTKDTSLLVKSLSSGSWRLSWSKDNFFKPIDVNEGIISETGDDFYSKDYSDPNPSNLLDSKPRNLAESDKPVVAVRLTFNHQNFSQTLVARLARGSTLRLAPKALKDSEDINDAQTKQRVMAIEANPGTLVLRATQVTAGNSFQPNQMDLSASFENAENFLSTVRIEINGYDVGYEKRGQNSLSVRVSEPKGDAPVTHGPEYNDQAEIAYGNTVNNATLTGSPTLLATYPSSYTRGDRRSGDTVTRDDWQDLEKKCDPGNSDVNVSFRPSSWDVDFSASTAFSWNVRPAKTVIFNALNASQNSNGLSFHIFSIADSCVIQSSANFVAGFLVCRRFVIEPRNTPLRIIGTILPFQMEISPSALAAGIRWSSIYHPNAVADLRTARILKSEFAPNRPSCDPLEAEPLWHPAPTLRMRVDRYNCAPISLRNMIDNFRWSTVNPDCGLLNGSSATTCKYRPMRFIVKEIDRRIL